MREKTTSIPAKTLKFRCDDFPDGALLGCPRFLVVFTGKSWSVMNGSTVTVRVDGRRGGFFPPHSSPFTLTARHMTAIYNAYGPHARETHFDCFGQRFVYRDFKQEIEVNGHRFSTHQFIALRAEPSGVSIIPPVTP